MIGRRVLLAGRISGDPMPLANGAGPDLGDFITVAVADGARSHLWAAFRAPGQALDRALADGDAVAIIGTLDPTRKSPGALNGPVTIDAVLGLKADGHVFRSR